MRFCKSIILVSLGVLVVNTDVYASELFEHDLCKLSFEYPAGWQIKSQAVEQAYIGAEKHRCEFWLLPNRANSSVYNISYFTIKIKSNYRSFLQAALDAQFRFSEGGWRTSDDLPGNVESIRMDRWYGLKGTVKMACDLKLTLPEPRECAETRYVLSVPFSDEGRLLTIEVSEGATDTAELLFRSLVFEE